eukprot:1298008-Pyramimonas_sp.AAC.1
MEEDGTPDRPHHRGVEVEVPNTPPSPPSAGWSGEAGGGPPPLFLLLMNNSSLSHPEARGNDGPGVAP